jgi:hypothetical protein
VIFNLRVIGARYIPSLTWQDIISIFLADGTPSIHSGFAKVTGGFGSIVLAGENMNDILSENVRDLHSRAAETGNAIGERVQNATTAAGIAAGRAGDGAQEAWSQAGEVAEDALDVGRRATRSVSRQIHENPLIALLVGIAVAFTAGLWLRGGGVNAKAPSPRGSRVAAPQKK